MVRYYSCSSHLYYYIFLFVCRYWGRRKFTIIVPFGAVLNKCHIMTVESLSYESSISNFITICRTFESGTSIYLLFKYFVYFITSDKLLRKQFNYPIKMYSYSSTSNHNSNQFGKSASLFSHQMSIKAVIINLIISVTIHRTVT